MICAAVLMKLVVLVTGVCDVAASTGVALVGHTVALTNSVDDGFAIVTVLK